MYKQHAQVLLGEILQHGWSIADAVHGAENEKCFLSRGGGCAVLVICLSLGFFFFALL